MLRTPLLASDTPTAPAQAPQFQSLESGEPWGWGADTTCHCKGQLSSPFNSPGDSPRLRAEPQKRGCHLPQPALRRGAEGRQAQRPGTLIFFRPRVRMPTPASIKLGYIKQTNRRHLPVITPDTSPDKRPLPRPPLTARTIAATKAFSACADDINLML